MKTENPNTSKEFSKLYTSVSDSITAALDDISKLNVSNDKGNTHLANIKDKLNEIKRNFDCEISYLEEHSEWEKFTIAFFGETNAGKSTIIESLRIIFNEQKRQELIKNNQATASDIQAIFSSNSDELIEDLSTRYVNFCGEISRLSDDINALVNQTQLDLQNTRQRLEDTQQDYTYCKERLSLAINDLNATRQSLQDNEGRLSHTQQNLAQTQGELQQVGMQLEGVRNDFQRSQQQLAEQGTQLQASQAQLSECQRQAEITRVSLEQRARMQLLLGLVVGTLVGVIAGAVGYAQLL